MVIHVGGFLFTCRFHWLCLFDVTLWVCTVQSLEHEVVFVPRAADHAGSLQAMPDWQCKVVGSTYCCIGSTNRAAPGVATSCHRYRDLMICVTCWGASCNTRWVLPHELLQHQWLQAADQSTAEGNTHHACCQRGIVLPVL